MILHDKKSPLYQKEVKIKPHVYHFQIKNFGGSIIKIDDWWDRMSGGSWMEWNEYAVCTIYAMRVVLNDIPSDNNVLYGKIGDSGYLVHISELEVD